MWRRAERRYLSGDRQDTIPLLPSIFDHIRSHMGPDGLSLAEAGLKLPDENYQKARLGGKPDSIGFAPGATDGILRGAPISPKEGEEKATALHEALLEFVRRRNPRSEARLVQLMVNSHAATSLAPLLLSLSRRPPENLPRLYEEMRRFFLQSGHREVVKYAMSIVASYRKAPDLLLFRTIACHPEFTMYAVDAISKVSPDPVSEWIALARVSRGWGKVSLVERLSESNRPEIWDYLLREGLENVPNLEGYIALPIAMRYKLHDILEGSTADPGLLRGAARILHTLTFEAVDGGPNGNILDYPDGGLAVERFLAHFERVASSTEDFLTVASIHQFVSSRDLDESRLRTAGWDSQRRASVSEVCNRILARTDWVERAKRALASEDPKEQWRGITVAKRLGIPLHDYFIDRLRKNPLDPGMWFHFIWGANEERIDEALKLAREVLHFESIATGPAEESLVGPGHERHDCVNYLLQELRRFPGKGWDMIRASLRSPVTTNRRFGLLALKRWRASEATEEVVEAVRNALRDPSEHVRTEAKEVLAIFGRSTLS